MSQSISIQSKQDACNARYRRTESGFSLVEIAVSIIIIGLLTAMIVKGGQMVEAAKVSSTVLQTQSIISGVQTFRTSYQAWPGDFSAADTYLDGCSADSDCGNGDETGLVDATSSNPDYDEDLTAENEPKYFWKHLYYSGLARGIPDGDAYDYGSILPVANMDGGFEMFYDGDVEFSSSAMASHVLRLAGAVDMSFGLNGELAFMFDQKMDDGKPGGGSVVGGGNLSGDACVDNGNYDRGSNACFLFIEVVAN